MSEVASKADRTLDLLRMARREFKSFSEASQKGGRSQADALMHGTKFQEAAAKALDSLMDADLKQALDRALEEVRKKYPKPADLRNVSSEEKRRIIDAEASAMGDSFNISKASLANYLTEVWDLPWEDVSIPESANAVGLALEKSLLSSVQPVQDARHLPKSDKKVAKKSAAADVVNATMGAGLIVRNLRSQTLFPYSVILASKVSHQ